MRRTLLLVVAGCSYTPGTGAGDALPRDGVETGDGPAGEPHLLISEVFAETSSDEFVEIYNPGSAAVPLDDVYLTDVGDYWKLPAGVPTGILNSDYLVRFPAGAQLAAGALAVIAVDGPTFVTRFGTSPAFTIRTPVTGAVAMVPLASAAAGTGAISDEGEMLVLFEWDGVDDRVRDLDIVVHGMPSGTNKLVARAPVDGPDPDPTPTAYATDGNLEMQMAGRTSDGTDQSYQRVDLDEREGTGGNGATGHDETTEPLDTTWSRTTAANPGQRSF